MVLGKRQATVETTLRETQEENDEFRRRILGLEQQLKEARGLVEGGEAVEARLRDKVHRLEVTFLFPSGRGVVVVVGLSQSCALVHCDPSVLSHRFRMPPCAVLPSQYAAAVGFTASVH